MDTTPTPHDAALAAVEAWFASLPAGLAEMRVAPTGGHDGTSVTIRPLRAACAAEIRVAIAQASGFVTLAAGKHLAVDDTFWPHAQVPLAAVCDAIVSGGMVEVEAYWRGRLVSCWASFELWGEARRIPGPRRPRQVWLALWRRLARGREERRVVRYAPY